MPLVTLVTVLCRSFLSAGVTLASALSGGRAIPFSPVAPVTGNSGNRAITAGSDLRGERWNVDCSAHDGNRGGNGRAPWVLKAVKVIEVTDNQPIGNSAPIKVDVGAGRTSAWCGLTLEEANGVSPRAPYYMKASLFKRGVTTRDKRRSVHLCGDDVAHSGAASPCLGFSKQVSQEVV
jgi:hypothetical protein